jgi:hypothetical protein
MAARCKTCQSPHRAQIELGLAHKVPSRILAKKFGVPRTSIWRHARAHLPPLVRAALLKAVRPSKIDLEQLKHTESEGLLQHLVVQRAQLWRLMDLAESLGDLRAVAQLHGRLSENLTLTGKLLGELRSASVSVVQNILVTPEYHELRTLLVQALRPYGEARLAVARVLQSIEAKAGTPSAAP